MPNHEPLDPGTRRRRRRVTAGRRRLGLAVAFLLFWGALQYPGWQVANRVEPFVLGLPFMLFWALAWWAVVMAAMVYAAAGAGRDDGA